MANDLHPVPTDPSPLAAAGFLDRYRATFSAYRNDLRCYWPGALTTSSSTYGNRQ